MDLELAGKAVVITGGSKGLGLACARLFAAEGAQVVIASRTLADLDRAVDEVQAATGHRAHAVVTDIRNSADVKALMKQAATLLGGIDVLVNNAGAAVAQPYAEFTDEHWNLALNYKLIGYLRCTMEAIPYMQQRGEGRIVNVAGSAGWESRRISRTQSCSSALLPRRSRLESP